MGGSCWSAAGTRWRIRADGPGGTYAFELEMMGAGRLRSNDHEAASPATDEWVQVGNTLRLFLAQRFVEYRATVTNGTVLLGEASNVRGQRWAWRGDRDFDPSVCLPEEARWDDLCVTVAGTRWHTDDPGPDDPELLEFLSDGVLARGEAADPSPGSRWTQRDHTVSFVLPGGRSYEARLESPDRLTGGWTHGSASGTFRASRVPTVPPELRP